MFKKSSQSNKSNFRRKRELEEDVGTDSKSTSSQKNTSSHDNDDDTPVASASDLMRQKKSKLMSSSLLSSKTSSHSNSIGSSSSRRPTSSGSKLKNSSHHSVSKDDDDDDGDKDQNKERSTQPLVSYSASGTAASLQVNMATRTLDIDGAEEDLDALKRSDRILSGEDAEKAVGESLYGGLNQYKEFVNKKAEKVTQSNAGGIRAGPLKGPTNVRISCRFDYQPDICKDYKETGYCGYGDSCKFMHDRGDYKAGWQIELEWQEEQKRKQQALDPNRFLVDSDDEEGQKGEHDEDVDEDDHLPFACLICRKPFKNPIITKCGHYFCESCAVKQYAKTAKCFACGSNTQGVFNVAKELVAKLAEKQKRMQEREAEIRASLASVEGVETVQDDE